MECATSISTIHLVYVEIGGSPPYRNAPTHGKKHNSPPSFSIVHSMLGSSTLKFWCSIFVPVDTVETLLLLLWCWSPMDMRRSSKAGGCPVAAGTLWRTSTSTTLTRTMLDHAAQTVLQLCCASSSIIIINMQAIAVSYRLAQKLQLWNKIPNR